MPLDSNRIPEIIKNLEANCQMAVQRAGFKFEAEAKSRARVRFGYMRGQIRFYMGKEVESVSWEEDEKGRFSFRMSGLRNAGPFAGTIVGGADYTIYNEYGTIYMSAQPMFWPAGEIVRPMFQTEIRMAVKKAVEG